MANEVTDPTDWLETPLAPLGEVESAFRCQVCKELMESPMITSCSHTFCSICIRRCLTAEGHCPLCRTQDQSNKLRKNTAMDEAITAFRTARPELLKFARDAADQRKIEETGSGRRNRNKRSLDEAEITINGESSPRKTRASSKRSDPKQGADPIVVDDSEEEEQISEPEGPPDDGLAACPICQKRMPEERVFSHLDTHNEPSKGSLSTQTFGLGQTNNLPSRTPAIEPLPGLNYSMLNETALRKKIDALGIPTGGNKAMLQRRHTEWVNIWNANCDSTRPRTKRELLRDLDIWERSQNKPQVAPTAGSIMDKEFDHQTWALSQGTAYKDLITKARENAKRKKAEKEQQANSGEASSSVETAPSTAQEQQGERTSL